MFKSLRYFLAALLWPLISLWPNITPDFICWFSKEFFDVHDYREERGGDGIPTSFHVYTCWNCGKNFTV
jgi:hypothetical protein